MARLFRRIMQAVRRVEVLPPPDRSTARFAEIMDQQARYAARLERQA